MTRAYSFSAALLLVSISTLAQGPKPGMAGSHGLTGYHSLHLRGGAPPANDECADAITLDVGTSCAPTSGNTDGATETIPPTADCVQYISTFANDVWYSFVATSENTSIEVTGIADFDAVLQVFSGTCGALESVTCADANFPQDPFTENMTEMVVVPTTIGNTYFVRAYRYQITDETPVASSDFTICAYQAAAPPANDDCTGAVDQTLAVGSTIALSGDNTSATASPAELDAFGSPVVWHSFTTTACANVTINYCVEGSVFPNFITGVITDCNDLNNVISGPNDGCSIQLWQLPAGTYLVPLLTVDPAPAGAYTVEVSAAACDVYCAGYSAGCDEFSAHVAFGSIDNASDCGLTYQDFTYLTTTVHPGEAMPITVINNPDAFYDTDQCTAWFDWNQDNDLEDAGEMYTLTTADGAATFTGSVTPPLDALLGATRMRVRMQYDDEPTPCGEADYGDVEDYTVVVSEGTGINEMAAGDWSIFPNPGTGNFTITGVRLDGAATIEIHDMTGRAVYNTKRNLKSGTSTTLDLNGLAAGTYNLSLVTAAGRSVNRLMVR